jgi:hypothetical protein
MRTLLAAIFNEKGEGKAGRKEEEVIDKESEYQDKARLYLAQAHQHLYKHLFDQIASWVLFHKQALPYDTQQLHYYIVTINSQLIPVLIFTSFPFSVCHQRRSFLHH